MKKNHSLTFKIFLASTLLIMFTCILANGQDIIIKKNGDEIKAKVEEVLDIEIKYRKFEMLEGPLYSIKKSEVVLIMYANGGRDVFTTQSDSDLKPIITNESIRRTKTGAIINYSLIGGILTLGTLSAVSDEGGLIFAASMTTITAIGIPTASIVAGNSGVRGSPGLRITGWISYGLFMADALTLLTLEEKPSSEIIMSVTILGALSTTFLALDKSKKVNEAKSLQSSVSLQPTIGYVWDLTGNKYNTIGFRINF